MKRKGEIAEFEAESSERNHSTGYAEAFSSPFQTPVSRKGGKAQKVPRIAKGNRTGSQTPSSHVGEYYYPLRKFLYFFTIFLRDCKGSKILSKEYFSDDVYNISPLQAGKKGKS